MRLELEGYIGGVRGLNQCTQLVLLAFQRLPDCTPPDSNSQTNMPLSQDSETLETSNGLVNALRGAQGDVSKSFRPGKCFAILPPPAEQASDNLLSPCKRPPPDWNIHTNLHVLDLI